MRDFCSFLERRDRQFRENHAEVNSEANPPALSTALLTLREPPGPDSTALGNRPLFAYSSRQHLWRASCTLLCACLVLEGSLQEAHSVLLKEPGLAGKGGTQAHQGRDSCSTASGMWPQWLGRGLWLDGGIRWAVAPAPSRSFRARGVRARHWPRPPVGGQVREAASSHCCGFRCLADVRPEECMALTVSGAQLGAEAFL